VELRTQIIASLLGLALGLAAPAARALPLSGDQTRVDLTSGPALSAQGIGLLPLGSASLNAIGELVLPISGGDVSIPLLEGQVQHLGAGFALDQGATEVRLEDLVYDLTLSRVSGTLSWNATPAPVVLPGLSLFDLRVCLVSTAVDPCLDSDASLLLNGFGMKWTDAAATVLADAFGPAGGALAAAAPFGVSLVDLRFVPEPATALLLAAGLAGLGLARRRPVR